MSDFSSRRKRLTRLLFRVADEYVARMLERSWFLQPLGERQVRLRTVRALVVEQDRVERDHGPYLTSTASGAIERVIEGDWPEATRYADDLVSDDVRDQRWLHFAELIRTAAAESARFVDGSDDPGRPH